MRALNWRTVVAPSSRVRLYGWLCYNDGCCTVFFHVWLDVEFEVLRFRLRPKMMVGVLGPLAVVLALFAYVQYSVQRNILLETAMGTATDLGNVIEGSLQHAMLRRDRSEIQSSFDDIATNPQVINLLLLNDDSGVRAALPRQMVGQQFDKSDTGCAVCHAAGAPAQGNSSTILTLPDTGSVLRVCSPIENREACHQCHDPDRAYNGVLITDLSLAKVEQESNNALQRTLFLLGGTLLLGAVLLGVTMERMVIQPLEGFSEVIRDFGQGHLRRRVHITSLGDEIEELARTFNQMADGVEEKSNLERELRQRSAELEDLYAALREKEAMHARLLRQTITAQEEERTRLARELHDEIGQMLTAVQLGLDRVARVLPAEDGAAQERLSQVRALTEQTLADVRAVITALRPGVLDQLGLVPALNWVAEHTLRPLGVAVTFDSHGLSGRLPDEIEILLFRIAQEAMSNVAHHSQADHLTVRLEKSNGQVSLTLADNGVGFDWEEVTTTSDERRGLGLMGMQERALLAGGQLAVESAPGHGTTVQVVVPVEIEEESEGK